MGALPGNFNMERIGRGHHGAIVKSDSAHGGSISIPGAEIQMHSYRSIHMGIFHNARIYHGAGTGQQLLGRLEAEFYGALQFRFMRLEQLGGHKQHGGVAVMAAGVTGALRAGKGESGHLLLGQGVHVCAQQNHRSAAANCACHTSAQLLRLIAIADEILHHIRAGLGQIKAQFRMLMQITPMGYDLVFECHCFL